MKNNDIVNFKHCETPTYHQWQFEIWSKNPHKNNESCRKISNKEIEESHAWWTNHPGIVTFEDISILKIQLQSNEHCFTQWGQLIWKYLTRCSQGKIKFYLLKYDWQWDKSS